MIKKIAIAALLLLLLIQLFSIDKTNPPVQQNLDFFQDPALPSDVRKILENACSDCHSHLTEYPWYTSVEPISWWIRGHIKQARNNLNFSEFYSYSDEDQEHLYHEIIEVIEEGSMPPSSYKLMHLEARLTDEQKNRIIQYFDEQ